MITLSDAAAVASSPEVGGGVVVSINIVIGRVSDFSGSVIPSWGKVDGIGVVFGSTIDTDLLTVVSEMLTSTVFLISRVVGCVDGCVVTSVGVDGFISIVVALAVVVSSLVVSKSISESPSRPSIVPWPPVVVGVAVADIFTWDMISGVLGFLSVIVTTSRVVPDCVLSALFVVMGLEVVFVGGILVVVGGVTIVVGRAVVVVGGEGGLVVGGTVVVGGGDGAVVDGSFVVVGAAVVVVGRTVVIGAGAFIVVGTVVTTLFVVFSTGGVFVCGTIVVSGPFKDVRVVGGFGISVVVVPNLESKSRDPAVVFPGSIVIGGFVVGGGSVVVGGFPVVSTGGTTVVGILGGLVLTSNP